MMLQLMINKPELLNEYPTTEHVLLLQDGMYLNYNIIRTFKHKMFYALKSDWLASGLKLNKEVRLISHQQWVELCAQNHPIISLQ